MKTAALRHDFELSSRQVGVLAVGEQVVILEERQNGCGQIRVRCSRGWSSLTTRDGTPLLKKIPVSTESPSQSELPVPDAPEASVTSDKVGAGWDEAEALAKQVCALESELSAVRAL